MMVQVVNTLEDEIIIRHGSITVLDLSCMTHLNSKFIGKMIKNKDRIVLYNLSKESTTILKGCNLEDSFKIAKTMKEAVIMARHAGLQFDKAADMINKNDELRKRCIALEILMGIKNNEENGDLWG